MLGKCQKKVVRCRAGVTGSNVTSKAIEKKIHHTRMCII